MIPMDFDGRYHDLVDGFEISVSSLKGFTRKILSTSNVVEANKVA